jgi:hypothetical protein
VVTTEPRDRETRKADTLAMLATRATDVWVATASAPGAPQHGTRIPRPAARPGAGVARNEIAGRTLVRDGTWLV